MHYLAHIPYTINQTHTNTTIQIYELIYNFTNLSHIFANNFKNYIIVKNVNIKNCLFRKLKFWKRCDSTISDNIFLVPNLSRNVLLDCLEYFTKPIFCIYNCQTCFLFYNISILILINGSI